MATTQTGSLPISSSRDACRRVVRFVVERYGGIDVLVNNAATLARGRLEDIPVERWDAVMALNLRAPFICLQEAVAFMKSRGGSILNIGSINVYAGDPKLGGVRSRRAAS